MKKIAVLVMLVCSLMIVSPVSAASNDLAGYAWAEKHILALAERDIMRGTGPNQYSPAQNVKRAEFATLITRTLNLPASEKSFSDLGEAHESLQDGVKRAAAASIVRGGTDGKFHPNNSISRQEMAVMVDRAMKYKGKQSTTSALSFGDAASILYKEEVGRIVGAKIMNGVDNGLFSPYGSANRAMAAVVISRMISHIEGVPLVDEKPVSQLPFVMIDAGHGGKHPGTIANGLQEHEVVLDISLKVRDLLQKKNIPHALTRETNTYVDVTDRVRMAEEKKADLFVSIHANDAGDSDHAKVTGIETLYPINSVPSGKYSIKKGKPERQDSKQLAAYIQKQLIDKTKLRDRKLKERKNLYVLNQTSMAAVMAEVGFVTHPGDAEKLKTQEYRQVVAEAICAGIMDYFKAKGYKL